MSTITVSGYKEANQTLAIPDLKQSLYDEGKVLMDRVLVTLHGEEHRSRRLLEMRIFKKDFFQHYEQKVLPAVVERTLARFLPTGRADLVDYSQRALLDLTADFAGIDRPDGTDEERNALVRLLKGMGAAATLGQYSGDREVVREQVRATLREFDERFFAPSMQRRQQLVARVRAGEMNEADLPRDILTILVANEDRVELSRDMILRETAFYYLAGAHTSVHSTTHALHEIFQWRDQHPEDRERIDRDPLFVQRCVHESLRLHPSSPIAQRRPLCPVHLPSGDQAATDDTVIVDLYAANRQVGTFGEDAAEFNPHRKLPANQPPYGLTFGVGIHTCLGRNLAAGEVAKANTDPTTHQYGTVALLTLALIRHHVRPDPANPPQRDTAIAREAWTSYPVLLGPATPPSG
ncbi:MAG: cytochrome P450 [Gammaproteobacteria bacterium]|nr:cytochrome P450 [Gammaproteobacteria bacterium]